MKELALCQAIMQEVTALAEAHQAYRVKEISLTLGSSSKVSSRLLELTLPMMSLGTVAEGARLVIQRQGGRIHCPQCHTESPIEDDRLACPNCGHWPTRLLGDDQATLSGVRLDLLGD